MKFENFIKHLLTTILGAVIMTSAYYGWWNDHLTNWQAGVAGIIGFALLWMRDQIPSFIIQFVQAAINKFFGGSKK